MRTVDTLLKTLSSLASHQATHNALAVYVVLQRFAPAKVPQARLIDLAGLKKTATGCAVRTLTDLGLVADGRVIDGISEAAQDRLEALSAGLLAVNQRTGAITALDGQDAETVLEKSAPAGEAGSEMPAPAGEKGLETPAPAGENTPDSHPHLRVVNPSKSEVTPAPAGENGGSEATCSETQPAPAGVNQAGPTDPNQRSESDLDHATVAENPQLSLYTSGTDTSGIESSVRAQVLGNNPGITSAREARRKATLEKLIVAGAWDVLNYWRGLQNQAPVDLSSLTAKQLDAHLSSKSYKAILRAHLDWGYSSAQLMQVADRAMSLDAWSKERFFHTPAKALASIDRVDELLQKAPKRVAQDRRGLGLGMRRPGEADTDHVELF